MTKSIRYSCVKHNAFCLQIDADSSGDEITRPVTHFHHVLWCVAVGQTIYHECIARCDFFIVYAKSVNV